ncbi:MAG: hypothetical protein ACR2P1_23245 [Pseudomonadales bacterium]
MKAALLTAIFLLLLGCMSSKSFVDPSYAKASYDDITPVASKYPVALDVRYKKHGEPFAQGNRQARSLVESTLWTTGVFDFSGNPAGASLKVVINNFTKSLGTTAQGASTSLSLGALGSNVTDYYEFSINYVDSAGTRSRTEYKHALHTTVGKRKAPVEHVSPTTSALGFATIVEQVMLNFVKDMQDQGLLP